MLERISVWLQETWQTIVGWSTSTVFYGQLAGIGLAIALALTVALIVKARVPVFSAPPRDGVLFEFRSFLFRLRPLIFPLFNIVFLGIAIAVAESYLSQSWLLRVAQGIAVIFLLYTISSQYIQNQLIKVISIWLLIPVATLQVFGWLDDVTAYLDSISLTAGDIRVSVFALLRTLIFGALLFWLGRLSNNAGKEVIRNQQALNPGTREVFAKLF